VMQLEIDLLAFEENLFVDHLISHRS
jgi:hypothetical protein